MHRAAVCIAVCVSLGGCSLTVQGPPKNYRPATHGRPDCTRTAPGRAILDGIWAGSYLFLPAGAAGAMASGEIDSEDASELAAPLILLTALASVHALAIAHGSGASARCERAHLEYARWYNEQEAGR